ncbi:unnamed protein product [Camellia sinensis]
MTITTDIRILDESTSFTQDNNESSFNCGKFTWTLKNFGLLVELIKNHKLMSPSFIAEDCILRISIHRSVIDDVDYLSLFLNSEEQTEKSNWCMFRMSVLNHKSSRESIHRDSHGRIGETKPIGWIDFMEFSRFIEPNKGFLVHDHDHDHDDSTAMFSVSFQVIKESIEFPKKCVLPHKPDLFSNFYIWKIENFTKLKDRLKKRKITGLDVKSQTLKIGDQDLRLVIYPRGESQSPGYLSFYLEVMERPDKLSDWSYYISFRLSVMNQNLDKSVSMDWDKSSDGINRFFNATKELGWCRFMPLNSLFDQDSGFLVADTVNFFAEVLILEETFLEKVCEALLVDEGKLFYWRMSNFLHFKNILETKTTIVSQTFQIGKCKCRIGVCQRLDLIFAILECSPSVVNDPDTVFEVRFRMGLLNYKCISTSWHDEETVCTKSKYCVSMSMKVSDILDPDNGFLYHESVIFLCQILHHGPSTESSKPGVLGLSNYLDKCTPPEYFEITSENVDNRLESFLRRHGLRIDSLPQPNVTKSFLIEASWMWSTMLKLHNYLEPVKAKYLLSAMDNFARNIDIEAELSSSQIKVWNQAKASQQVIIDLLLDIIVEYCRHLETRSSVSSVDYYDTSSEPPSHRSGVFSRAEFLRQNGPEDSAQYPKYKTLEEKRTDVSEKAILESPPSETSAIDLLTINSIQDLKIKWPEPSEELLSMIINSLKCLCDTVPQGCSKPKRWPVSVKKISHVLDKAPKQLQLDLITLVPKLVDHSDHSRAAYALIHQLSRPDADPELQIPVFSVISQLDLSSEVQEHVFFLTSKLVVKSNDGALATTIGFLFKAASHCQHISKAVRVVRVRLCRLGIEVSPCVLNFLSEIVTNCCEIAKAFLRDVDSSFELDDKDLTTSGGTFLYDEDEYRATGLNMMDDQILRENRHFSDIFTLIQLLSVPSLKREAFQVFERAVSQGSIVVHSVSTVLERCLALRLNIGPIVLAGENQQRDVAADEKIEPSLIEAYAFVLLMDLVESFSLSLDSRVYQFAQMFYATLFRLFADESYHKMMLKGLVDHAISHTENVHQADRNFSTLLFLVNEELGLAGPIFKMMREVSEVANVKLATLRDQLHVSEDQNLRTQEEKRAEHANMVREKASLLEKLSKSEATTNHFESKLKLEIDRSAKEKKNLKHQLELCRSQKNDEITKLSAEKNVYEDSLHNWETQFSLLKSRNSDDLKRLEEEKNDLAERLKTAESARKRSDDKLNCLNEVQTNVMHSLQDEIGQLKLTVEQLQREKLDKDERINQLETDINGMEANFSAFQRLEEERNDLAERLKTAESDRKRSDDELNFYAGEHEVQTNVMHSLQDEIGQLKLTVEQLEREKLDKDERINQLKTDIHGMEANFSACQQRFHVALIEEMALHAPLYGIGLEGRSWEELETLMHIHQTGLEQIDAVLRRGD